MQEHLDKNAKKLQALIKAKPVLKVSKKKKSFDENSPVFSISIAAEMIGVHQRTLRIYDEEDILSPKRSDKKRRLYSMKDIEKGRKLSYIPILAAVVGFGMLGLAFYTKYGSAELKDAVSAHNDLIGSICIIALGAGMIIGNLLSRRNSSKVYTVPVQAVCVELKSPKHGSHVPVKLSPVYEYTYNGVTHRVQNSYYSNKGYPRAGETREIFINPDRADGYFDPIMSKSTSIGLTLIGGFFIFMGVLVLILG